jgi:TrmH family RNA methyltransferase
MLNSATNAKILHLTALRKDVRMRKQYQSTIVTGEKFIRETMEIAPLKMLLTTYELPETMMKVKDRTFLIPPHILTKITGLHTNAGMVAEFVTPEATQFDELPKLLVLDRISDPGNLGAIIRSQIAFGWEDLFLLPGCCDLFNDKVVRSSAASVFRIKWQEGTWEEMTSLVKKNHLTPYVADMQGKDATTVKKYKPCLLLSNEGAGISNLAEHWGEKVSIPMATTIESLNAAVAGALLLYILQ